MQLKENMKLTIKTKLILGFTAVLGMLTVSAVLGIKKLSTINNQLNTIVDSNAAKVELTGEIDQQVLKICRGEKNMILDDTVEGKKEYVAKIETYVAALEESRQKLDGLATGEGKAKMKEFADQWQLFMENHKKVSELALLNSNARAQALSKTVGREALEAAEAILSDLESQFAKRSKDAPEAMQAALAATHAGQNLLTIHREAIPEWRN